VHNVSAHINAASPGSWEDDDDEFDDDDDGGDDGGDDNDAATAAGWLSSGVPRQKALIA
jgi:hypothetical protein